MAFGDVSNISRNVSRDDLGIGRKNTEVTVEKSFQYQREAKPAALLRPAQRTQQQNVVSQASVNGTSVSTTNLATAAAKQSFLTSQPAAPPTSLNSHKALIQRDTAIFKDSHPVETGSSLQPVEEESSPAMPEQPAVRAESHEQDKAKSSVNVDEVKPREKKEESREKLTVTETNEVITASRPSENAVAGRFVPSRNEPGTTVQHPICSDAQIIQTSVETTEISPQEQGREILRQMLQERDQRQEEDRVQAMSRTGLQHVLEDNELEEYWLDEEEEENYDDDDDGYTTARSFRSRGDNTTGGPTMVLFPKVNSRIRKELATAKQIVEMTRSVDEIEEENWDTTMVAEYGDEIFEYMRELEVSLDCYLFGMLSSL